MQRQYKNLQGLLLLAFFMYLLAFSVNKFQSIAWGTGNWWGEYSMKWAAAYVVYILLCVLVAVFLGMVSFLPERFRSLFGRFVSFRERLGKTRWLLAVLLSILPVWFFQFTPLGVVFNDIYTRVLVWSMVVAALSFLFTRGNLFFGWVETLLAVLVTSSEFVIAVAFMEVTNHPFSLGWSEGNRLWDYSMMFGRQLYDYPADQTIPVLLDAGRQFVGGLPFLIPGLTIGMERFWVGLTIILPYLFLGFAIFRADRKNWMMYVLTSVWALIFLKQGPIHPPLVLCAVVVALTWRSPLWLAIPLIAVTGYAAQESRYTWLFAPGMWIGMLDWQALNYRMES